MDTITRRPMTPRSISPSEWLSIYSQRADTGCIIFTGQKNQSGYGDVRCKVKNGWPRRAHRLAWVLANGPIPDGMYVCHRCDVRSCINPDHLFLGTNAENLADMKRKGRASNGDTKGSKNGRAKLTEAQVLAIRADERNAYAIATAYGLGHTTVKQIKRRETWAHLTEQ